MAFQSSVLSLLSFSNADPDPAFHSNAVPDFRSKINADPDRDPQPWEFEFSFLPSSFVLPFAFLFSMDNAWGIVRCVLDIVMQQKVNYYFSLSPALETFFLLDFLSLRLFLLWNFSIVFSRSWYLLYRACYTVPWGTVPCESRRHTLGFFRQNLPATVKVVFFERFKSDLDIIIN